MNFEVLKVQNHHRALSWHTLKIAHHEVCWASSGVDGKEQSDIQ